MGKPRRPKAPRHCYWEGGVLYGRQTIKGQKRRWSLRTSDPELAAQRVAADREHNITAATYGDTRTTWGQAVSNWNTNHIPDRGVSASTADRYAKYRISGEWFSRTGELARLLRPQP
jgi:hypothetical protein